MHESELTIERALVTRSRPAPAGQACLVAGCPCKDPRIVSHRRAAFFAARARGTGETADRTITADAGWRLPATAA